MHLPHRGQCIIGNATDNNPRIAPPLTPPIGHDESLLGLQYYFGKMLR